MIPICVTGNKSGPPCASPLVATAARTFIGGQPIGLGGDIVADAPPGVAIATSLVIVEQKPVVRVGDVVTPHTKGDTVHAVTMVEGNTKNVLAG